MFSAVHGTKEVNTCTWLVWINPMAISGTRRILTVVCINSETSCAVYNLRIPHRHPFLAVVMMCCPRRGPLALAEHCSQAQT